MTVPPPPFAAMPPHGLPDLIEHDACALAAFVTRDGKPDRRMVDHALVGLQMMVHRSGSVDGEGDGSGLLIDIPRPQWSRRLTAAGLDGAVVNDPRFVVGHVFFESEHVADDQVARLHEILAARGFELLWSGEGLVDRSALGPRAAETPPVFWQLAALAREGGRAASRDCYQAMVQFELDVDCHVASFSANDVVYKVQGQPEVIPRFYPEFADDDFAASRIIAHNRYSTNTYPTFSRVQPFSLLGHNGEINTIAQLREQAQQLGLPITHEGSDSQDLNRLLEGLVFEKGLSLLEAVEFALPPILGEVHRLPAHLQDLYVHYREALGPYAQGPVALATRAQNEMVFAVDAMGLRPLWWIETDDWYVVSSEPGIIEVSHLSCDPRPLGPGEKMAVVLDDDGVPHALEYPQVQQQVYERAKDRGALPHGETRARLAGGLDPTILADDGNGEHRRSRDRPEHPSRRGVVDRVRQAAGRVPRRTRRGAGRLARVGRPAGPVHAGADAALGLPPGDGRGRDQPGHRPGARGRALLHPRRPRTAPADPGRRDRAAATLRAAHADPARRPAPRPRASRCPELRRVAVGAGRRAAGRRPAGLGRARGPAGPRHTRCRRRRASALPRSRQQAVAAVRDGAEVVVLHDMGASADTRVCDPMLAVAAVDKALREQYQDDGDSVRRNVSLLLQAAGIRNVHDVMVALGLGAQALIPYAMLEYAVQANPEPRRRGLQPAAGASRRASRRCSRRSASTSCAATRA